MNYIHRLSPSVIQRIAAGEIIERPAYIVKELVENALDAQTNTISIVLQHGGKEFITVSDTGIGIHTKDLALALERYTTSKIDPTSDLTSISTFGFRGEALYSIAHAATLDIVSRTTSAPSASHVRVTDGIPGAIYPHAGPQGTTVRVTDIFATLPTRKKFLKSDRIELRHCLEWIESIAIAHPWVSFRVVHNGNILMDLPTQTPIDRFQHIYSIISMDELTNLNYTDGIYTFQGILTLPTQTTKDLSQLRIYVNNRHVRIPLLVSAVKEAYGASLAKDHVPYGSITIYAPVERFDVTVHPRKESVTFYDQAALYQSLLQACAQALGSKTSYHLPTHTTRYSGRIMDSWFGDQLRHEVKPDQSNHHHVLGQVDNTFIVVSTTDGIQLIDQHAAHERILYEILYKTVHSNNELYTPHVLSEAVIIPLTKREQLVWESSETILSHLNFDVRSYKDSIAIVAVPKFLSDRDPIPVVRELLSDLITERGVSTLDTRSERMMIYIACRSAIKAGDVLSKEIMEQLIADLAQTPHNTHCPHGRPISKLISRQELHQWFKRK